MKRIPMGRESFQQIIEFYVFNCPVAKNVSRKATKKHGKKVDRIKVSKIAYSFEERNIRGSDLSELLRNMRKCSASGKIEYGKAVKEDDIVTQIDEWNQLNKDPRYEYICVYDSAGIGITKAVFYCIRNAFAHGSFEINDDTYTLKSDREGKKRGEIRVKEKTLLNWISLVNKATR